MKIGNTASRTFLRTKYESRLRLIVLFITMLVCIGLAFYVGFYRGMVIVYTHFFYVPILLAGMWYGRKAIYIAILFGIVHVLVTHFSPLTSLSVDVFLRMAIFVLVACVTGYVSGKGVKLQNILDAIPESIFIFDRDYYIRETNKTHLNTFGLDRKEIIGKKCYELFSGPECTKCPVHGILEKKECARMERAIRAVDGTTKYFDVVYVSVFDDNGEVVQIICDTRDITERKKMWLKEEMLANITKHSADVIMSVDNDLIFSFWNRAAEEIYGWKAEEVMGKHVQLIIPGDGRDEFAQFMEEVGRKGFVSEVETERVAKDGRKIPIQATIFIMRDEKGEKIGYSCIHRDITERKQREKERKGLNEKLEEAVRHANDLAVIAEHANKAKSIFLANMSHEIRTPINAISGLTELTLDTELTDEQRANLKLVKSSANSLLSHINDILDLSKIEAGEIELEEIDFDLLELLNGIVRLMRVQADEKGLELLFDFEPGTPQFLRGDPNRLKHILMNLIGNAIKFTDKGEVLLRVKEWGEEKPAGLVGLHILVKDTGIGIPEEKQEYIFDPFTQADRSTTRKYGGTGLGLNISKRIVEMIGGEIWVESKVGTGSTFHFTVFLQPADAEKIRELEEKKSGEESIAEPGTETEVGLRVLLAEDNEGSRELAIRLLEKNGCQVTAVENGLEALEALEKEDMDLVFMDVEMPEMDGREATQKIRAREGEGKYIPIIAMTTHAMSGDRERFLDAGMDDYISKPIDLNSLSQKIKYWRDKIMAIKKDRDRTTRTETTGSEPELREEEKLLDIEDLLNRVGRDEELAREILTTFAHDCPEKLSSINEALDEKNAEALKRSAHTLKGAAANVSAVIISELAFDLWKIGERGELTDTVADEIFAELEHKVEETMAEMRKYLKEGGE